MNFDFVAVSDIWSKRREEGVAFLKEKIGHDIIGYRNNEELYASKNVDAVFVATSDFQHALHLNGGVVLDEALVGGKVDDKDVVGPVRV